MYISLTAHDEEEQMPSPRVLPSVICAEPNRGVEAKTGVINETYYNIIMENFKDQQNDTSETQQLKQTPVRAINSSVAFVCIRARPWSAIVSPAPCFVMCIYCCVW